MKRDFNSWLGTMKDSIASWTYYTDFQKVYENVNKIKVELNILNSLIGSKIPTAWSKTPISSNKTKILAEVILVLIIKI